ncbi:cupin domain-containing protein [Cupriavidus pinatubonensis]|uniref:cupin domain-containing protein n=1 Tax=Cupriavidus pinatubonensis TaxID=248026 RepID=UPI00112B4995|nr:cupin domain-containing protein [Cupriavidus pinatubonensis]TPQ38533.1 hypothetical protein C2U69_14250 [Cupriavidus pinatubonensis]
MLADYAADRLIKALDLLPHPEGGYFRETYRSVENIQCSDGRQRSASTAIYYMLRDSDFSAWHRIRSDELWHFHAGTPLDVHVLTSDGNLVTHRLGNPLEHHGAVFQAMVPAHHWFAAERVPSGSQDFSLLGCTVAPGFEFSEFELADASELVAIFPRQADLIHRLSRRHA